MYRIDPIKAGSFDTTKNVMTYLRDPGEIFHLPVGVFLIRSLDEDVAILVDTGMLPAEELPRPNPAGGGPEPIVDGLADHGLAPGDVDHVILTHLHHDHASNNWLFPDAEFIVQRRELEFARDPPPLFEGAYLVGGTENIAALDELDVTVIDGAFRLREGIDLLLTPGHSVGMQSVLVETAAGPHALICDLAYCRHNLEPSLTSIVDEAGNTVACTPSRADYLPPVHTDIQACLESMALVRERVEDQRKLILSHDPRHLSQSFPGI